MALHDHFRPPLSVRRHWHAFHNARVTYVAADLNAQLIVVDVVTGRSANLHDALLARLAAPTALSLHAELYAVAYRPVERHGQPSLDIWQKTLVVGHAFPSLPLWLRGAPCVQVALEATYERTCREQRITINGI